MLAVNKSAGIISIFLICEKIKAEQVVAQVATTAEQRADLKESAQECL